MADDNKSPPGPDQPADEPEDGEERRDEDAAPDDLDRDQETDDEAPDEADDDEADDDEADDEPPGAAPPRGPSAERRTRPGQITMVTIALLLASFYGANCWLNVRAAEDVRQLCWAEDQRLGEAIEASEEDRMPVLDWMISLFRARRRYIRELCDGTTERLVWWRWNLTTTIEVDVSAQTKEDITRILSRASMSCEGEINDMERALEQELDSRTSGPDLRAQVSEMVRGHRESCEALRDAHQRSTLRSWPPLEASGQLEVATKLLQLMPRATQQLLPQEREGGSP